MELVDYVMPLAAAGMDPTFFPADEEFDLDRIDVPVNVDGFDAPLTIQITEPPVVDGALGELGMVQIYVPIPVALTEEQLLWMALAAAHANELVPLIGFSVHQEASILYYRTIMLLPPGEIALTMVVEGVSRAHYALDLHAATLISGALEEDGDE